MALSANTVWEVRTTGSDNNGGGFVSGASGTDYSQQDAAQFSGTDLVIGASNGVASVSHSFVAADIGNIIQITAGTGFTTGFYQIISVAAGIATLDRSPGTLASSGGTWAEGGALASPGGAAKAMAASGVAGMKIWIKSGTYTLTNTTVNTAAGPVQIVISGSTNAPIIWEGYGSSRGDLGARPVISAGSQTSLTIFGSDTSHFGNWIKNITVDGNSGTSTRGFSDNGRRHAFYLCKAQNCTNNGFNLSGSGSLALRCQATGCTTQAAFSIGSAASPVYYCEAFSNTVTGFTNSNQGMNFIGCLSYNNSGASSDGFAITGSNVLNCVAYGNGRDGFRNTTSEPENGSMINCIAEGNTGWGFGAGGSARAVFPILNCATYNNNLGGIDTNFANAYQSGNVAYTATAFVSSTNLALNNNAGGGASLRAAGFPGAFPAGTTTGYQDIGAAQHADPAAVSGGSYPFS